MRKKPLMTEGIDLLPEGGFGTPQSRSGDIPLPTGTHLSIQIL